jgi:hypothetical protein
MAIPAVPTPSDPPMKTLRSALCLAVLILGGGAAAHAQVGPPEFGPAEDLERLVSPIALYPDPLIALILPASTHPSDIVLASRFLAQGRPADAAANEPWDESVRGLARYREVIEFLDRELHWTRRLGEAFLDQPAAVMNAIQAVRARANASGLLSDTREQEVIIEQTEIRIIPAQPTVIYVPRYDPEIIFIERPAYYYPRSFFTFGVAYGIGTWLSYDCDWRYQTVRVAHRSPYWYHAPDWRHYRTHDSWARWSPGPRHERRRHDDRRSREYVHRSNNVWTPPAQVSPPSPAGRQWSGDHANRRSRGDVHHERRHGDERRREVARPPRPVTAPEIVASSPSYATAPQIVTQPIASPPPMATQSRPSNHSRGENDAARAQRSERPTPRVEQSNHRRDHASSPPAQTNPTHANDHRPARGNREWRRQDNRQHPD